jgi:Bifunctional DNA primase/polymerase, N-terminal
MLPPARQRDLDLLCAAVTLHGWKIVLLLPRSKRPTGTHWHMTSDPDTVCRHVVSGGNVGLVTGDRDTGSDLIVFDIDRPDLLREMETVLGPLGRPWVMTGSGRLHFYFQWEPNLPAKIIWKGETVGEIQRGGSRDAPLLQQVVLPPSIHPVSGEPYKWLHGSDVMTHELPEIPPRWIAHLSRRPDPRPTGEPSPTRSEPLNDSAAVHHRIEAAMQMPGAKRRARFIKFRCPRCRAEGRDRSEDNAGVNLVTGTFGCARAQDRSHWESIRAALDVARVLLERV